MPLRSSPLAIAFAGLVALAAAMGIGRFVYTPLLPLMVADLGLSGSTAGLVASANFLGYVVGAVAAGMSGLPGSRRAWMLAALATSAATTAAMGATASVPAFLVLRFVGGAASAFVLVYSSTLVLDRLRLAGRPGLSALHFAGVGVGIALSSVLIALGSAAGLGWPTLWVASGVLSAAALAYVALAVPADAPAPAQSAAGPAAAKAGGTVALVFAYGLFGLGYVVTATFLVLMVRTEPALRPVEPVIWLVVGLAAAPSVALWSAVAARLGAVRGFALAAVVEAVGVAASVLWPTPAGVILAAVLLGGTFMGLTALGIAAARAMATGDPRPLTGRMTAAFGVGQMIGPSMAGALADRTGSFTAPSLVAVAALLVAAAIAFRLGSPSRRPETRG